MSFNQLAPIMNPSTFCSPWARSISPDRNPSPFTPSNEVVSKLNKVAMELYSWIEPSISVDSNFLENLSNITFFLENHHEEAFQDLSTGAIDMTLIDKAKEDLDLLYRDVQSCLGELKIWGERIQAPKKKEELVKIKKAFVEECQDNNTPIGRFFEARKRLVEVIFSRTKLFSDKDLEIPQNALMLEAVAIHRSRSLSNEMSSSVRSLPYISYNPSEESLDLGDMGVLKGSWTDIKQDLEQLKDFYKQIDHLSMSYVDATSDLINQLFGKLGTPR